MDRTDRPAWTPEDASRMYRRVLAGWAMDALVLRRAGLETPSWRTGLAPATGREERVTPATRQLMGVGD